MTVFSKKRKAVFIFSDKYVFSFVYIIKRTPKKNYFPKRASISTLLTLAILLIIWYNDKKTTQIDLGIVF